MGMAVSKAQKMQIVDFSQTVKFQMEQICLERIKIITSNFEKFVKKGIHTELLRKIDNGACVILWCAMTRTCPPAHYSVTAFWNYVAASERQKTGQTKRTDQLKQELIDNATRIAQNDEEEIVAKLPSMILYLDLKKKQIAKLVAKIDVENHGLPKYWFDYDVLEFNGYMYEKTTGKQATYNSKKQFDGVCVAWAHLLEVLYQYVA